MGTRECLTVVAEQMSCAFIIVWCEGHNNVCVHVCDHLFRHVNKAFSFFSEFAFHQLSFIKIQVKRHDCRIGAARDWLELDRLYFPEAAVQPLALNDITKTRWQYQHLGVFFSPVRRSGDTLQLFVS